MEIRNLIQEPTLNEKENLINGTAVVFNRTSEDLGGFTETIKPGAFDGVDMSDVVLLYNHETGDVLARTSAQNMAINVDDQGLNFEAKLPDTTLGRDTMVNLSNHNVRGMSFGFTIAPDGEEWEEQADNSILHVVTRIGKLFELSLTPFPAYKQTDVAISQRSLQSYLAKEKEAAVNREWLKIQREVKF